MEGWEMKRIEELSKTTSGGTPSRKNKEYYCGDILWVKSGELEDNYIIDTEEKITQDAVKNSSAKLFPKGTILMAMYGATVGKTAILKKEATTNQAICGIIPNNDNFNSEFLRYQLIFKREDFLKQRYGGAQPNISQNIIKKFKVAIPSLPEQRKIAHVLSTVQKAIEQQDKLIRTTTELKKAIMQKLFTEGTRGEPQKETEIGLVPESWKVVELGKHSYIRTSFPTFNKLTAKYKSVEQGTVFFFLKVSDMNMAGNEIFIYESNNKFLNDRPTDFANGFIKPNSLIFPKRGAAISTNKKRITTKYSVLDPNLIGVEPNSNIDAKFLYNFFEMFDLSSLQDNNVIPQLNKHNVAGVKFPLPSIEEQRSISKYIENFDKKITLINKKKQTLTDLFKTLLHELMTGQRRVHELEFEIENAYTNRT